MKKGEAAIRILFTVLLCGMGLWYAINQETGFLLGGETDTEAIHVDATGFDAVVVGAVFIAVGIINLALAIAGPRRIPVFWTGVGLLLATVVYGMLKVIVAVVSLFET